MAQEFTNILLKWQKSVDRNLPWKDTQNPYKIWLSEIILQQTRVDQGLPYYNKFVEHYPTVQHLAQAPEDEVMKLWQGLGYYSRARNLHAAAKYVVDELNGRFPENYEALKKLKGVGDYTAAAIASFAFNEPRAVVDGNVFRVLSRYFGIDTPIDSTAGKKAFAQKARELIDTDRPGEYNQAIMNFGALQCVPRNPLCHSCPLQQDCVAYQKGLVNTLPVKAKKLTKRPRYFHYLVIRRGDTVILNKRGEKDIWRKLYDFPVIEQEELMLENKLQKTEQWRALFKGVRPLAIEVSKPYKQVLSHQHIHALFYYIETEQKDIPFDNNWVKCHVGNLNNFAFPKIVRCYLENNKLY